MAAPPSPLSLADHQGKAGILRARPKCRLAQAGVAEEGDVLAIHVFVFLQIVHGAAGGPRPGADGAPLTGAGSVCPGLMKSGRMPWGMPPAEIGLDIGVIHDRQSVARGQDLLHLPARGGGAARSLRRGPFDAAHPLRRRGTPGSLATV